MEEKFAKSHRAFFMGMFSSADGTPSSTRILLFLLAGVCSWLLIKIVYHVATITDPAALAMWLGNLPMIVGALIAFAAIPYTVGQGAGLFSTLLGKAQGKNNGGAPGPGG